MRKHSSLLTDRVSLTFDTYGLMQAEHGLIRNFCIGQRRVSIGQ